MLEELLVALSKHSQHRTHNCYLGGKVPARYVIQQRKLPVTTEVEHGKLHNLTNVLT